MAWCSVTRNLSPEKGGSKGLNMESTDLTGQVLIALPSLEDDNFTGAVIYVTQHSGEGAMGVVLNQPSSITLGQVLDQLHIMPEVATVPDETVLVGGPVQQEQGFVLHSTERLWDQSMIINDFSALTSSRDILQAIATGEGPEHYRLFLGYAGWGAGQLEGELGEDAWITVPGFPTLLFETPFADLRDAAASALGVDMSLLIQSSGHA